MGMIPMQEILVMLDDLVLARKMPHEKLASMSIHEKIKEARQARGWSMEELATHISAAEGLTKPLAWQTVQQWESGKSAPRRSRLDTVARVLGINTADLLMGGEPFHQVIVVDSNHGPEVQEIRTVKLRLRAGIVGFSTEGNQEAGPSIFLPTEWLVRRGLKADCLIGILVRGDSMEPTLFDGDTVLINTKSTEARDGRVFAINYEGEPIIKRLVRDAGDWWLSSDSSDQRRHARKLCADGGCLLIGEVVYRQSERI